VKKPEVINSPNIDTDDEDSNEPLIDKKSNITSPDRESYETWTIEMPIAPKRTTLYSIAPIGDNRVVVRYVEAIEGLTMQPNLAELTQSLCYRALKDAKSVGTISIFPLRSTQRSITSGWLRQRVDTIISLPLEMRSRFHNGSQLKCTQQFGWRTFQLRSLVSGDQTAGSNL